MDYDKYLGVMSALSGMGAMSPKTQAMAAQQGNTISNMAQAHAQKQAEKAAKKAKRSAGLGKLGSILGGVAGSMIGGPILGSAIGSALGGTVGQVAGGGNVNLGDTLGYGAQGALGGVMGRLGASPMGAGVVKQGTAQAPAMVAKPTATTQATPAPTLTNPLPQVTGPVGNNTVLAPSTPPAQTFSNPQAAQPNKWAPATQYLRGAMNAGAFGISDIFGMGPDRVRSQGQIWQMDEQGNMYPLNPAQANTRPGYFSF